MEQLTIAIPVYNEAENIIEEIEALEKTVNDAHIVNVIYDFDEDTTVPVVKNLQGKYMLFLYLFLLSLSALLIKVYQIGLRLILIPFYMQ